MEVSVNVVAIQHEVVVDLPGEVMPYSGNQHLTVLVLRVALLPKVPVVRVLLVKRVHSKMLVINLDHLLNWKQMEHFRSCNGDVIEELELDAICIEGYLMLSQDLALQVQRAIKNET